ncbi:PAS domain-containing sensor histidine kinase [Saliphagus sp. GCM10025308]
MGERPKDEGVTSSPAGTDPLSSELYRTLADAVPGGVFQLDTDGRVVAVNDALVELTGYSREELVDAHPSVFLENDSADRLDAEFQSRQATGADDVSTLELTTRAATGESIPCELRLNGVSVDGTTRGAVCAVRDVSDRLQRDAELESVQDAFESMASVLDEADVGVFLLDSDFEIVWADRTIERFFDLDREAVVGRDKRDVLEETIADRVADPQSFVDVIRSSYEDNTVAERFECRLQSVDGTEERWLEHRSNPITAGQYAGGRIELYYDVTGRKRSEVALYEREEQLRTLVEAVDEYAIFMLDTDGTVVTWNTGAREIKGYTTDDVVGEHFSTFYPEEDAADGKPERLLATAREEGQVEDEGWRVRKDGSRFWANVVITAIRDDGDLVGYAKVTRDMTERREYEEQLRRERDQTEQLLRTSPIAISVRDADSSLLLANHRARELFGLTEPDLDEGPESLEEWTISHADGTPFSPTDRPAVRVLETGNQVLDQKVVVERPSGDRLWLSVSAAPVFDDGGDLQRIITTAEDITGVKEREQQLESELGELLGRISDAFYALDEEYRFTHVNERAEELLQASEEELLGESLWEMFPEAAEVDEVWDAFHTAMDTQEQTSYELYFDLLDFWVEANIYPSETGVSVYFRDVTERIEREQQLAESERRYRTLAEHFPNGVVMLFDEDLRCTLAAGQAFEHLPISADELEGQVPAEMVDESAGRALESAFQEALDGTEQMIEVEYAGRQWSIHTAPITDVQGGSTAGMAMAQDITERNERIQKLEQFASVVSHGLRNPLGIAQIYTDMARQEGNPEDFDQIEQSLDRMETIIENLLTTSREGRTVSDPDHVSLSETSVEAWQNVETGEATLEVDDDLERVLVDEDQLHSLFENLFRNAVQYGGEAVTVRVRSLEDEPGFAVEDTGPGIPAEKRDEVLQYGYTSGSGTGIGLAVVRDIAQAHGWGVSITDGEEGGARFEFRGLETA